MKRISVEERLPEQDGEEYLLWSNQGVDIAIWDEELKLKAFPWDRTSHWQPLPPPPGDEQ